MTYVVIALNKDHIKIIHNLLIKKENEFTSSDQGIYKPIEPSNFSYVNFVSYKGTADELADLIELKEKSLHYLIVGLDRISGYGESGLSDWIKTYG